MIALEAGQQLESFEFSIVVRLPLAFNLTQEGKIISSRPGTQSSSNCLTRPAIIMVAMEDAGG